MQTQTLQNQTTQYICSDKKTERFIFVLRLHDGRIAIGSATNPCKRIASLNSGYNPKIKQPLMVNEIIGIKPLSEGRTLPGVFRTFEQKYPGKVIDV